jgi:hypothetical protein
MYFSYSRIKLVAIQGNINKYIVVSRMNSFKGQYHEIFDLRFFSLNGTPGSSDLWAVAVLYIDSNLRRNRYDSTTKIDSALCRIARSRNLTIVFDFSDCPFLLLLVL